MDLSRIRRGEMIAAAGGVVLLIALLFVDWYSVGTSIGSISIEDNFGAWDHQGFSGTLANLIILAAAIAAVGLALVTATSRTIALPVAASALTAALGIGAVAMVLLRMLFQPGPNGLVDLKFGILLALIGALVVAYGGWDSMKEEGTSFDQAREQLQARYGGGPSTGAAPPPTTGPGPMQPPPAPEGQPPSTEHGSPPSESRPPPGPQ